MWAAKVRVKSVTSAMVGMPSMEEAQRGTKDFMEPAAAEKKDKSPSPLDLLRGVIGK